MKYALLEPTIITSSRRDGNSTRQVDLAVQILFGGDPVEVRDHWHKGEHRNANVDLFVRILKRMNFEHPGVKVFYDKSELIISLNEEHLRPWKSCSAY